MLRAKARPNADQLWFTSKTVCGTDFRNFGLHYVKNLTFSFRRNTWHTTMLYPALQDPYPRSNRSDTGGMPYYYEEGVVTVAAVHFISLSLPSGFYLSTRPRVECSAAKNCFETSRLKIREDNILNMKIRSYKMSLLLYCFQKSCQ